MTTKQALPPLGTKTNNQVHAIWGLARAKKVDSDTLHALVERETGKTSIRALSKQEADKVIEALGGTALTRPRGQSKRSQQYRRKRAGIVTIANDAQKAMITNLAKQLWGDKAETALAAFCASPKVLNKPAPQTSAEASRLIETLKAKRAREERNG
jgi:hypothetical protein